MNRIRFFKTLAILLVALTFSMMRTAPVFADDSAPPPQTEESADLPPSADGDFAPVDDEQATPAPADDEQATTPAPVDDEQATPAPADDEQATTPAPADDEQATPAPTDDEQATTPAPADDEQEPPASLLEQTPEDTQVVVLDENGESVPLATNQAADAIANGDPQWCPNGVKPGSSTCSDAFTSFQELLDWLAAQNSGAGPNKSGTIWIESTYISASNDSSATQFTLNGASLTNMANVALTIQGGWTGIKKNINPSAPSEFNVPLAILGWNNAVTVKNVLFTGIANAAGHTAALQVTTTGKITLVDVDIDNNYASLSGAELDNTSAPDNKPSDVVVTNSSFTRNQNVGLTVNSDGAIIVTNLTAIGNGFTGVSLDNTSANAKPVTLKGVSNLAKYNTASGLFVYSNGAITINNLSANENGNFGAYLNNTTGSASLVKLTGVNSFNDNGSSGLYILSNGAVSLNNITSNDNGGDGTVVDNHTAIKAQAVTLTGNNTFSGNDGGSSLAGLAVMSKGAITLNNVVADSNGGYGVFVNNIFGANTAVAIKNSANFQPSFNYNGESGLAIYSNGAVTIMDLDAAENGGYNFWAADNAQPLHNYSGFGVIINNMGGTGNVTLGTMRAGWCNGMSNNFQSGLVVNTNGAVTLSNLCNDNNGGYNYGSGGFDFDQGHLGNGAYIDNAAATTPKPVVLKGANRFSGNIDTGLVILATGAITASNISADNNWLIDIPHTRYALGVYLENTYLGSTQPQNIAVNGVSAEYNGGDGLGVVTYGAISGSNLNANYNGWGVYLNNCDFDYDSVCDSSIAPKPVTLAGTNRFDENNQFGLRIISGGAIKVSNLSANGNLNNAGALLDNSSAPKAAAVTISGYANTNNNGGDGLFVTSLGEIKVANLAANGNVYEGAYLYNSSAPKAAAVTISGHANTNNNGRNGLFVTSLGEIKVANLAASFNIYDGAYLDNFSAPKAAAVTISGYVNTDNNSGNGLTVQSLGAITINVYDITASNNSNNGWSLQNDYSGAKGGVTLTAPAKNQDWAFDFWNNLGNGLYIQSFGAIKITGLDAGGNGSNGAYLNNSSGSGAITISAPASGLNSFNNNADDGLLIISAGAISVGKIEANDNGESGAILLNTAAATPQNVVLSGFGRFDRNGNGDGLYISSKGAITASNLSANENGWDTPAVYEGFGIYLDNDHGFKKPVALKGYVVVNDNAKDGLHIISGGAITVSNIAANSNLGSGAWLYQNPGAVGGVTVTGSSYFSYNGDNGMYIDSQGFIKLNSITAASNGGNGLYADNTSHSAPYKANAHYVTLSGVNNFSNNSEHGLRIFADGNITLSNIVANGNGTGGALVDNCLWNGASCDTGNGNIVMNGVNMFNHNSGANAVESGLFVYTNHTATLSNITADLNDQSGVKVTAANIAMSCSNMALNGAYGWDLLAGYNINLKGVVVIGVNTYSILVPGTFVEKRGC